MVKQVSDVLQSIEASKKKAEFMPTGFPTIDTFLDGGFLRKELVVIGAFTGTGKSYVGGQMMINIAKAGFKCAYFSLEISSEMIVSRLIGGLTNIKPTRINWGNLTASEWQSKEKARAYLEALGGMLSFYDDMYTLDDILKEIRANKYEFVVVDFLQNLVIKGTDEYSRLTTAALELQRVAKEVNGTVCALSQLSNTVAREGSKAPILEYKGSGAIATVCDLGFIFERGDPAFNSDQHHAIRLHLRKNRRGISGQNFDLRFALPGGKIYEPKI